MDEQAVDARALAALLNVSVDTVYRLASTREIPSFRIGRLLRFWPSDVRAQLERPRDTWERSPQARAAIAREERKRAWRG